MSTITFVFLIMASQVRDGSASLLYLTCPPMNKYRTI